MDNQRLLVWVTFGMMLWFCYLSWVEDYAPPPPAANETASGGAANNEAVPAAVNGAAGGAVSDDTAAAAGDALSLPALSETIASSADDAAAAGSSGTSSDIASDSAPAARADIRVTTDVMEVGISTQGGSITSAVMLGYPLAKDRPDELVRLLSPQRHELGLIHSGLRSTTGDAPGHTTPFQAAARDYDMDDDDVLVVPLRWTDGEGLSVEKRFTFRRGSYAIEIAQTLHNDSAQTWRGDQYTALLRRSRVPDRSMFNVSSYSFDGPISYDGAKSEKLDRDDLLRKGALEYGTANGWVGAIQHHFLSAIVPETGRRHTYRVAVSDDTMTASVVDGELQSVAAGASHAFRRSVYVGPKLQAQLAELHEELKLTVDYGLLTILSQPMFWLLAFIFRYVGNWGVAIIVVTLVIKLVFYKLTESSGRSMAKMRNLQPRMKALQERYKDDRQQLSQQMMELYKREQVNPVAGCLPILVQMPFFLAFYWVLVESVEMRQAPFMLWIADLSSRDPYFILPLIMGAAMLVQQKLNPAPADPMQARVMQIMPIVFTGFFAFFPSGLVLYWATNTLLSIAQQWKINRVVEREARQRKSGKKPRKKNKAKDGE